MNREHCQGVVFGAFVLLLTWGATAVAADPASDYQPFDPNNFDRSTVIDNPWLPFQPGIRFVWDGTTVDDEGDEESHSVVLIVTDLTKVIGGVRTVVCWERDIVDGELEEAEIFFVAQDNDGTVWLMGEYPEEYDGEEFVEAPCWIHGIQDARAGIRMLAEPKLGSPSYSQGWAPSVDFTDRGIVHATGQKTTVPVGTFSDVVVIAESSLLEPNSNQLKFIARGVGCVRIGWSGDPTDREEMQLVAMEKLSEHDFAMAREEALKLERSAYQRSKHVFGPTQPSETPNEIR